MIERVVIPYEDEDSDALIFRQVWTDGRIDELPLGVVYDEGDETKWAPMGEVAVLGSYCAGSMTAGFDGARLARHSDDLWVCVFGDEDREFIAIRANDPHDAFTEWFSISTSRLDQFNWKGIVAVNAMGMVEDLPAESEGFVDAGLFEDVTEGSSSVDMWGVDVFFEADGELFPRDWLLGWAADPDSWVLAAQDPTTPQAAVWAARKDVWLGLFDE